MTKPKVWPRKKLDIPAVVSGRPVTNRGVHLQPFGFHGDWVNKAAYWTNLMADMGISWVVLLTDGDSVRQTYHGAKSPLEYLLDAGIIPIIREQKDFPRPFTEHDTFRWTVDLYGRYGLKPFWIIRNEPFDSREWLDSKVLPNAWEIIMRVWAAAAQFIAANGGYVGFPDGPSYSFNPFKSIKTYDCKWIFDQGLGFYAGHHYGKNRPRDYPYDPVTRYGAQLTREANRRLLDDFGADPAWREEPIALINQRRKELAASSLTPLQDDTCWRGWELVAQRSLGTWGYVVPMALTEGGWVPRDRPGSGPDTDIRMPHTTPKMVAKRTLQMYDTPSPFFAICPWLLADQDMGGSGWPFDAWHGWAYSEKYGAKKPVITALTQIAPREIKRRTTPLVIDVNGDTRNWAWVGDTYGVRYRRGATTLQLIEIHECEGPATLDAWVVDSDGLPVEGVSFYHYYPDAPAITASAPVPHLSRGTPLRKRYSAVSEGRDPVPGQAVLHSGDEWYDRGDLLTTGPDGRLSFPAQGAPGAPGTGQEALWPQGKGDVLEKLGMLAGARNQHLNGLWQLVKKGTPPLPPQPEPPSQPAQPAQPEKPEGDTAMWKMKVAQRPGPRVIAGTFPRGGIEVVISDPWGNASTVVSGSKPEHGPGGFEVVAPHPVTHRLSFLGNTFEIQMGEGTSFVTFTESPEPVPEPQPEPQPEPEPSPSPGDSEMWALILAKLERIEELITKLPR